MSQVVKAKWAKRAKISRSLVPWKYWTIWKTWSGYTCSPFEFLQNYNSLCSLRSQSSSFFCIQVTLDLDLKRKKIIKRSRAMCVAATASTTRDDHGHKQTRAHYETQPLLAQHQCLPLLLLLPSFTSLLTTPWRLCMLIPMADLSKHLVFCVCPKFSHA